MLDKKGRFGNPLNFLVNVEVNYKAIKFYLINCICRGLKVQTHAMKEN